jgi:hypothetical protein
MRLSLQVRLSKYLAAGGDASLVRVEPFFPGQIYDYSRGSCVHVLPPASHARHASGSGSTLHNFGNSAGSAHPSLDAFA